MKLYTGLSFSLLFFWVSLFGQGHSGLTGQSQQSEIVEISAESLFTQFKQGSDVLVINVLNKGTFKDCSIKRSVHIPIDQLKAYAQKMLSIKKWQQDKPLVVYCASYECPLSKHAYKLLKGLGFSNVKAYEGGMRDWKQKGYPVFGNCKADYLKK